MYTQCPDCSTAFRVTADVLKMAAGKVRCGGCGHAFNALEYLSESIPQQPAPKEADASLPELTPEPTQADDGLPASISAEQSAALLKTLDELAGSDIRIEDTGVEWRVLDDDDVGEAASDSVANEPSAEAAPANDGQASQVDELLEESPTPVDEFLTETPPQVDSPEIFEDAGDEPSRTSVDELRFDDDTPLPDDFDLDDDSSIAAAPASEPEDLPEEPEEEVEQDRQADLDLSEPDEWTDILGEFEDLAQAVAEPLDDELDDSDTSEEDEAEDIEPGPSEPDAAGDDIDELLDMDSQFALQAEAMGIDLSGVHESVEEPELDEEVDLELLLEDSEEDERDIEDLLDEDRVEEFAGEEFIEEEPAEKHEEPDADDEPDVAEDVAEDDAGQPVDDEEEVDEEPDEDEDFDVPPLTEEEQTINMQIDQDLLALAVEDEDGFASTIVIAEGDAETKARKEKKKKKKDKKDKKAKLDLKDTGAGFETIIMEGEHIRNNLDSEKFAQDAAAAASLAGAAAAEREAELAAQTGKRSWGVIAATIALVLLLAVQGVHQSREALATIPAFNEIAGPLYRAIGMPLAPDWDITGWRFEATRHSVGAADESELPEGSEDVMIFSRVGNSSDKPLPYPIIGISLTDRYEEPVGGFALDPADYLPDDLDPRKLVEPGNTFNAVMTIRSPSTEAESFRLRACYRNADGSLRCKDDSFK
jgi:predicted Zn finger-like uncharacterized protein